MRRSFLKRQHEGTQSGQKALLSGNVAVADPSSRAPISLVVSFKLNSSFAFPKVPKFGKGIAGSANPWRQVLLPFSMDWLFHRPIVWKSVKTADVSMEIARATVVCLRIP